MISPHDQLEIENTRPGVTLRRPRHDASVMEVVEATYEAGTSMRTGHTHDISEIYYIVSGRLRVQVAGEEAVLGPGSFFFIAAGTPHEITEVIETTTLVNVTTPEGAHSHAHAHGEAHSHGNGHTHGHEQEQAHSHSR